MLQIPYNIRVLKHFGTRVFVSKKMLRIHYKIRVSLYQMLHIPFKMKGPSSKMLQIP